MLNPDWCKEMKEKIESGQPLTYRTRSIQGLRFIILELNDRNIPFRIINLGAGIKIITTKTDICPKCKGTGRC
jgi:hypothetical protein